MRILSPTVSAGEAQAEESEINQRLTNVYPIITMIKIILASAGVHETNLFAGSWQVKLS